MVWDEQGSEKDLKSIVVFFMFRVPGSELQQLFFCMFIVCVFVGSRRFPCSGDVRGTPDTIQAKNLMVGSLGAVPEY